jgi:peptide methionine sulfoxide reductase MsrB
MECQELSEVYAKNCRVKCREDSKLPSQRDMFNMGNRIACLLALAIQLPLHAGALRSATFSASAIVRFPRLGGTSRHMAGKSAGDLPQTEEGWRTILNPQQFKVLREKSTEPSGFSERTPGQLEFELKKSAGTKYPKEGTYDCVACGAPLYTAQSKFDSGCGWPAFYEGVPGAIKEIKDAGES